MSMNFMLFWQLLWLDGSCNEYMNGEFQPEIYFIHSWVRRNGRTAKNYEKKRHHHDVKNASKEEKERSRIETQLFRKLKVLMITWIW